MTARMYGWIFVALSPLAVSAAQAGGLPHEPLPGDSASTGIRPSYQACLDASGSTTPGMLKCSHAEYAFQDKRLNSSYRKLASSLSSPQREALRVEELAWVQHKESYCAPEEGAGQGQEITSADCLVGETAKRATEIEARIK